MHLGTEPFINETTERPRDPRRGTITHFTPKYLATLRWRVCRAKQG